MVHTIVVSQANRDLSRAARVLSQRLLELGCAHAYIGGFAWSLLGSSRSTQMSLLVCKPTSAADCGRFEQHDIDVLIDVQPDANVHELREQICTVDKHFVEFGLKFYFIHELDADLSEQELLTIRRDNVLIETLGAGSLGLPVVAAPLFPVPVEEGEFSLYILHPSVLILTKMKRWAMSCDSTRPKTIMKCRSDEQDLRFAVNFLVDNDSFIGFDDYQGKSRPQLLSYVRKYRDRFLEDEPLMEALKSAMRPYDWADMVALQVEESSREPVGVPK